MRKREKKKNRLFICADALTKRREDENIYPNRSMEFIPNMVEAADKLAQLSSISEVTVYCFEDNGLRAQLKKQELTDNLLHVKKENIIVGRFYYVFSRIYERIGPYAVMIDSDTGRLCNWERFGGTGVLAYYKEYTPDRSGIRYGFDSSSEFEDILFYIERVRPLKYKILSSFPKSYKGENVYRIRACRDFLTNDGTLVKRGELGGYVASYRNLSDSGRCWIKGSAIVSKNARVRGNALVKDNAIVTDNASLRDDCVISGHAKIAQDSSVFGKAKVYDFAYITGHAEVKGRASVFGERVIGSDCTQYHAG